MICFQCGCQKFVDYDPNYTTIKKCKNCGALNSDRSYIDDWAKEGE